MEWLDLKGIAFGGRHLSYRLLDLFGCMCVHVCASVFSFVGSVIQIPYAVWRILIIQCRRDPRL